MGEIWKDRICEETIVFFVGAFDVPTRVHSRIVRALRDRLKVQHVICWVRDKAQEALHMKAPQVSLFHRLQMMDLAMRGEENVTVSDMTFISRTERSAPRPAKSLIDVALAAQKLWSSRRIAFAMGADHLVNLHLNPQGWAFLDCFPLIVLPRPSWNEKAQMSPAGLFLREQTCRQTRGGQTGFPFWQGIEASNDSSQEALELLRAGQRPSFVRHDVAAYAEAHRI